MKLLIVDDSGFARRKLKEAILREQPMVEILEAANGEDALQILDSHQPDGCVTDLLMPKMDGLAFLQAIKSRAPDVKIAVMSADIQQHRQEECLASGATVFIEKPISPPKVAHLLAALGA